MRFTVGPSDGSFEFEDCSAPIITRDDIVIAVMGATGVGKSTFISHFTDRVKIGHGLDSCTSNVDIHECTLPSTPASSCGKLFLVDTPGFDDTFRTDADILGEIATWLAAAYHSKIQLTGIIYLHRITDVRVGGTAMKNLRMFKKLCGDSGLGSVVLATTFWSCVTEAEGLKREKQLCETPTMWGEMIKNGSTVLRQDMGEESATKIIRYLIQKRRPVTLDIQRDMVDKGATLGETAAGKEASSDIEKLRVAYEERLMKLQQEMNVALAEKDHEYQKELDQYKRELDQKLKQVNDSRQTLQANVDKLERNMEEQARQARLQLLEQVKQAEKMANREREISEYLKALREKEQELAAAQRKKWETMREKDRREKEELLAEAQRQHREIMEEKERLERELESSKKRGCVIM